MERRFANLTEREQSALSLQAACAPEELRFSELPVPKTASLLPAAFVAIAMLAALVFLEVFAVAPQRPAIVLFPAGTSDEQGLEAVVRAGGMPIRTVRPVIGAGVVWIAAMDDPAFVARVRSNGASLVLNLSALTGCLLKEPR